MIFLTKLDGKKILVNLESIKYIESVPDTIVFFLNGDSIMVKGSIEAVSSLVVDHKANILARCSLNKTVQPTDSTL